MSERKLPRAEHIKRRAYELYLERAGEDGHDLADWLAAERELTKLSEQSATTTAGARSAGAGKRAISPKAGRT